MTAAPNRPRNPRGEGGRLREQLLQATAELLLLPGILIMFDRDKI